MSKTAFKDEKAPQERWGVYVFPWGTGVKQEGT